ncbi:ABC transporter transmembrane domain-containing protein [Actinoplanes sp. NPDC026670]|uniref:ABC transporter transmembrane domain-containing protein n=1 Tax=Actinoplanes sp. NPDC026670 TaxID=3154700 RepID=UPI0033CB218D
MVSLHVAAALAGLASARLIGDLVQGIYDRQPVAALDALVAALAGFLLVQVVLTAAAHRASGRLGEQVLARLREEFITRVLTLPLRTVEQAGPGDLLTRVTRDVDALSKCVRFAVPETMTALITLVLVVGALIMVSPIFAVPLLAAAPVMAAGTRWYLRRAAPGYLRQSAMYADVTDGLAETVQGARTVEAFGQQRQRMARTDVDLRRSWRAERYTLFLRTVWWPVVESSYLLALVLTLLIGGWLYQRGLVTLGAVTAAVIYAQQLVDPLDRLVGWLDEISVGSAALARLVGIRAESSTTPEQPAVRVGTRIELSGVHFAYQPGHDVLHDVNLTLRPGERLVVVGVSGAGKSTLGRLLAGIQHPTKGTIAVGGVALATLAQEQLRTQIALVTQENHIFIGTLRDNLAMARPDAAEAECRAALTAVQALTWVDALPDGIDTVVGAGGHLLSPAQAQQISLARIVLGNPHTVILDEATAALDRVSARDIERSLAEVLQGRTIITIAHRLFSTREADRIAVLEGGRIVELGSHAELVAADRIYAALWRVWHGEREERVTTPPVHGGAATSTVTQPPPGEPETTPEPQRFLVGNLPSHAPIGEEISLIIRITQQQTTALHSRLAVLRPLSIGPDGADVRIIVEASRGLAAHSPLEQMARVPRNGDSDPLRFAFKVRTIDLHLLRVTAWAGGTFLAELDFQFATTDGRPGTATATKRAPIDDITPQAGEVTLQVQRNGPRYTFQLLSEMQMFDPVMVESLSSGPDDTTEQIIQTLRQLAKRPGSYTKDNVRSLMQGTGIALWDTLVPETIQDQFWQLRSNIRTFSIATGLDTVPWELMYPMTKTADEGFLIEQVPVTRRVYNQPRARRINIGGARFVIPPGSPDNAHAEIRSVYRIVAGDGEPPVVPDLARLLQLLETGPLGLVHFACHTTYQPKGGGSSIAMCDGDFVPTLLERAKKKETLADSQPLIFINACRSAGAVPHYTRMMGWAQQFLAAGAGGFVGTLWDVRSDSAQAFAETFYSSLTAGATLGDAALAARRQAAQQSGDPTWLAYSVYGDPSAMPTSS